MPVVLLRDDQLDTSYLHVAGPKPDSPLLFMVPGNPGVCQFYEEFVSELATLLPEFEIITPSHCGYDISKPAGTFGDQPKTWWTLDEQVAHKRQFLEKHVSCKKDVYIFGHSVGAWCSQRLAVQLQDHPLVTLKFLGLLMPTIKDIAKSDQGNNLSKLRLHGINGTWFGYISRAIYFMPQFAFDYLFVKAMPLTVPKSVRTAAQKMVVRPSIVRQALEMAAEELHRIGSDVEPEDIKGFWTNQSYNVWVLFAQVDNWVSVETRDELIEEFSDKEHIKMEIVKEPYIIHGFCIRQSAEVARYVHQVIDDHRN